MSTPTFAINGIAARIQTVPVNDRFVTKVLVKTGEYEGQPQYVEAQTWNDDLGSALKGVEPGTPISLFASPRSKKASNGNNFFTHLNISAASIIGANNKWRPLSTDSSTPANTAENTGRGGQDLDDDIPF